MLPSPGRVLAHGPDAVLLEEIETLGAGTLVASAVVRPGTPFSAADGSLGSWAGPELMAQAVSAFANLEAGADREPSIGLLLGVRDYRCNVEDFGRGSRLCVEVVESSRDEEGRGVFDCRILEAGRVLATGRLTVFRPHDPWAALGGQIA